MKRLTTNEFIIKAKGLHGDRYDYAKVNYKNSKTKIIIICPEHGEFKQRASAHIGNQSQGCPMCNTMTRRNGLKHFLNKAKEIHGNKFDYSFVIEYKTARTKIPVICKKHGKFLITPHHHINRKQGCSKCKCLDNNIFIDKTKVIHGDTYNYNLVDYKNNKTKVIIVCSKHGEFSQRPSDHLSGCGCPTCNESIGEREIRTYLKTNDIKYIKEHKFKDCKNKRVLPFDFYLPDHNICIEFNGIQHYELVKHFGGLNRFKQRQINDNIKSNYCSDKNINLIIIKYNEPLYDKLFTIPTIF